MKTRPRRSDAELEASATDVTYEIQMMIESGQALEYGTVSSPPCFLAGAQKNMALESFLLHYRNLRAFLFPSLQLKPREDDVIAADFLGKESPDDVGDPSEVGQDKERLDKMLAHISYSRRKEYIAKDNIYWEVGKMAAAMLKQVGVFVCAVPEHMKPWFPDPTALAQARGLIDRDAQGISQFTHTISRSSGVTLALPRKEGF
jgi:hypothetical protein